MNKQISIYNVCVFLLLIFSFPLASVLPAPIGWENGFIENTQVVLILLSSLLALSFNGSNVKSFALPTGITFLLMTYRELSWGRVFLTPTRITAMGPSFPSIHTFQYYQVFYVFLALIIFTALVLFYKRFNWEKFSKIPLPQMSICLVVLAMICHFLGEHHYLPVLSNPQAQIFEELSETVIYLEILYLTIYYKLENKSV